MHNHCFLPGRFPADRWFVLAAATVLLSLCSPDTANAQSNSSNNPNGANSPTNDELTVMTWNLEWFYDDETGDNYSKLAKEQSAPDRASWNWKRDAVAESIANVKPTIVALQEVENRRVLWYLTRALERNHSMDYREIGNESKDHYTEQDVGFVFRFPADLVLQAQLSPIERLHRNDRYHNLTKHQMAVFEFPVGDRFERITVMNLHLRSRAEASAVRVRQARLLHAWLAPTIERGEHVIVLGDFNTEEQADQVSPTSDLAVACGIETATKSDDLVDLHSFIEPAQRQTHMIPGKQFDRILVSRSLLEPQPGRKNLVFKSIEVRKDLSRRGEFDVPQQHWDNYWKIPEAERDVSDHYPVIATFEVR